MMENNDHGDTLPTRDESRLCFSPVFHRFCGGSSPWRIEGEPGGIRTHPPRSWFESTGKAPREGTRPTGDGHDPHAF